MSVETEKPKQLGGVDDVSEMIEEKPNLPQPENFPELPTPDSKPDTSGIVEPSLSSSSSTNAHPDTNGHPERSLITPSPQSRDETSSDRLKELFSTVKLLDANRYATKKTIAQGMLDVALLTVNASQLKYILQVGKQHEFYTLMLTLICLSIGLQIVLGIIFLLLGGGYNINKEKDQKRADTWNNIALAIMVLTLAINVLISTFEIREINHVQETPKYSGYYQY